MSSPQTRPALLMARNTVFAIEPLDPLSYAAAMITLRVVAALAAVGPARRALRIDPLGALRTE